MKSLNLTSLQRRGVLPAFAGNAPLCFEGSRKPHLRDQQIVLPRPTKQQWFFQLQFGRQFVFVHTSKSKVRTLWFAGWDEQHPFVSELGVLAFPTISRAPRLLKILKTKGEKTFYEALKPCPIRRLERLYDRKARRQGDFWFFPLDCSWTEFRQGYKLIGLENEVEVAVERKLFGANHYLTGTFIKDVAIGNWWRCWVGEGIVTAPHHSDVVLEGLHIICWAKGD